MFNRNVQLRKYTLSINKLLNYFKYINKWLIILWKKCFILNLQEVSDMLATLVLIAEIWILRKSHFWLTSMLLILFLYFVADRAECACLQTPWYCLCANYCIELFHKAGSADPQSRSVFTSHLKGEGRGHESVTSCDQKGVGAICFVTSHV